MKTIFAALLVTSASLFGQSIHPISHGPVYDRQGRIIAYRHPDGTRDLYSYEANSLKAKFVDRAGDVTQFSPRGSGPDLTTGAPSVNVPIDPALFITYGTFSGDPNVDWIVCGMTQQSNGCFGSGTLGPFGKVAALIEGNPSTNPNTSTVTRYIYILDVAAGAHLNAVALYVYKRTDVITATDDNVTVTLSKTLNLPLGGGTAASGFMAGNTTALFIGTDQTAPPVQVQKQTLAITVLGGMSNVSSITADPYGFIVVTSKINGNTNFAVFEPSGLQYESGAGPELMLNTAQAALSSTFP
jgi:YD repeat-containing protein